MSILSCKLLENVSDDLIGWFITGLVLIINVISRCQCCKTSKQIQTSETFAVVTLKFEQSGFMCPKNADRMANYVDPDQTASEQPDLDLYCLPRPVCPKSRDHYGIF